MKANININIITKKKINLKELVSRLGMILEDLELIGDKDFKIMCNRLK